jgi:UDP-N-acetylmuramoyl-tripeptide--D-alanyl-D-alanine ligase
VGWQATSDEVVKSTGAKYTGPQITLNGVATDSREKMTGQLFVALKGDNFDAHNFIKGAVENDCAAILVHEDRPEYKDLKIGVFLVEDTLRGLQDIAHAWRKKNPFLVIGVSGSNGKTSTKEFAYQILKDFKKTTASQGSFNNHWGVPITILSAPAETKILLLEMGMNHRGELTRLAEIAEPDITVITMVGKSHVGELGSQEEVAKAKEELYLAAPRSIAIFNIDNEYTRAMFTRSKQINTHKKLMTFSSHVPGSDVELRAEKMNVEGLTIVGQIAGAKGHCTVKVFGRQNINNLMTAASIGLAVGMTPQQIWKKLDGLSAAAWGRNQWLKLPSGQNVLFDGYNANPESMSAMLKNLYELDSEGRRVLILGEMRELGSESRVAHQELGELAGKIAAEIVWFIGEHHKDFEAGWKKVGGSPSAYFSAQFDPEIANKIKSSLKPSDIVAVKASRGQKLETVLEHWGLQP